MVFKSIRYAIFLLSSTPRCFLSLSRTLKHRDLCHQTENGDRAQVTAMLIGLGSGGRSSTKVAIRNRKYRVRLEARSSQRIWRNLFHLLKFLTGLNS